MKYIAACALFAAALLAGTAPAAEDEGVDENALIRAQIFVDQGDLKRGLASLVRILRASKDDDLRSAAREELETLGLSAQEIFTLDPAKGKPEDLNGLVERIAKFQARKRRAYLDHQYATQILHDALVLRFDGDDVQAELRVKDAAKAAEIFVKLALDDKAGDAGRESQEFLEKVGVAGAKIDAVKLAAADDKLPDEVLRNMTAAALFMRLEEYHQWREDGELDDDHLLKQRLAKEYGVKLYRYMLKHHGNDEVFHHNADLTKYWSGIQPEQPKAKPAEAPAAPPAPVQPAPPAPKPEDEKDPKF